MSEDLRTKVVVGSPSIFGQTEKFVMGYRPEENRDGTIMLDQGGNIARLHKLGGVKVGSEGRLLGGSLKVSRSYLADYRKDGQTAAMGLDLVELIPVELTEYKQVAWFPNTNLKVVA